MYKKQLLKLLFCPLFLLITTLSFAQTVSVSGKVTDDQGQALPGVSVSVQGTTAGVRTDINGSYSIKTRSSSTLLFSMIGYSKVTVTVGSQTIINVTLKDELK